MDLSKLSTMLNQTLNFKREIQTFGGKYRKDYYKSEVKSLELSRKKIEEAEGRKLAIVKDDIEYVIETIFDSYKELSGCDATWILEAYIKNKSNAGAKEKYDNYSRLFFAWFVHHLMKNGASQLQSEELVLQLVKDDKTKSSENLKRIIGDSYREYKTKGYYVGGMIFEDIDNELEFLPYMFNTLPLKDYPESTTKAFSKALDAYEAWIKQALELIKRPLRQSNELKDNPIINKLCEELNNPLDYFHGYTGLTKEQRMDAARLLWKICRE